MLRRLQFRNRAASCPPARPSDPTSLPQPMSPDDGGPDSRTSSPSLTERMRSLASRRSFASSPQAIISRSRNVESSQDGDDSDDSFDVSQPGGSDRPPSIPEPSFREAALQDLDHSRPRSQRVEAARRLSREIGYYPPSTIMAVWDAAEDLAAPDAELRGRSSAFRLLDASASHPDLSSDDRSRVYKMATQSVDATGLHLQIKVLNSLTKNGTLLEPFQEELVSYLSTILPIQYLEASSARRMRGRNSESDKKRRGVERGLYALLDFISAVLTKNPGAFIGEGLDSLLKGTIRVAEKTTSKVDMSKTVGILRATAQYSRVTESQMRPCIEVLCAIWSAVPELKDLTRACLNVVLRSPDGDETTKILLETVQLAPRERQQHSVAGAIATVCQLVIDEGAEDLPIIAFSQVIDALHEVHFAKRLTRRDCLKGITTLLQDQRLTDRVLESNWDNLVQIILTATGDENYIHDRTSEPLTIKSLSSNDKETASDRALADEITVYLHKIASSFNNLWTRLTPEQRQLVGLLQYKLRLILPADSLKLLIKQLFDDGYYTPGQEGWQNHQLEMLRLFVWDREMDSSTCCMVIHVLTAALPLAQKTDFEHFHMIILRLLNDQQNQLTLPVANDLAVFAASTWKVWQPSRLEEILERLWSLLKVHDANSAGNASLVKPEMQMNTTSIPFVGLFLDYLDAQATQTIHLYTFMIEIAKAAELSPSVRIPALRLLTRLRCDEFGHILVITKPDSLGLAATLCRTEATMPHMEKNHSRDHSSAHDDLPTSRNGRSSSNRVNGRTSGGQERLSRLLPTPPLWMYPGGPGLPQDPPSRPSPVFSINGGDRGQELKLTEWLIVIIDILQQGGHWEVYSYVLVHLPSQLSNPSLFSNAAPHIQMLRNVVASQLQSDKFQEPPANTGVKKGDVALCLYHSLTMLLGYSEHFARAEQDDLVRSLLAGIGGWDRTAKTCLQGLAVACYQIPSSIGRALNAVVQKMSQIITQSHLAMDILEFLAGLARLPVLYVNFREEEFRTVFAVCVKYLEHARDQRQKLSGNAATGADYNSNRLSGTLSRTVSSDFGSNVDVHRDLPQYVFALAYQVITVWFLALKLTDRSNHVGWITANLAWQDQHGNEYMEEQSQVTLDMMHRTAYLDLGETAPGSIFAPSDGNVLKKTWLVGLSIVTIETAAGTGLTQITKRQASGTTYATYRSQTAPLPPHHAPLPTDVSSMHGAGSRLNIFPNHVFLQLTSTIAPVPNPMEPICLPDDDMTKRAISSFDRNDTVDGYKVGVIFIGNGQTREAEILANTRGSKAFETFLEGLGTKVQLRGASFNTQGLDREMNSDGTHTYAWRDRVAEIVFHVPTMMPTNLEYDPQCTGKKRHIGNDFVNIIFNESGLRFKFDTFPSQFNCVNIVICPDNRPVPLAAEMSEKSSAGDGKGILDEKASPDEEANTDEETNPDEEANPDEEKTSSDEEKLSTSEVPKPLYYTIQTVSHPSFPHISPAASTKLVPLSNLPTLARQLAFNCSVFSNVWTNRAGGEVISSWRNRLREIHKLRARFANTGTSTSAKFPGAKGLKTYVDGDAFKGRVEMGGLAEEEGVLAGLDFSRWAGPNPPLS